MVSTPVSPASRTPRPSRKVSKSWRRIDRGPLSLKFKTHCNQVKFLPPKREAFHQRGGFCSERSEYQKRLTSSETLDGPRTPLLGFERAIAVVQDCKLGTVQDFGSDFKVIFKWGKEHVAFDNPFEPRQVEVGAKRQRLGVNLRAAANEDFPRFMCQ